MPMRMATPVGLEPTTSRLEVSRSIQLSYGALRISVSERQKADWSSIPRT